MINVERFSIKEDYVAGFGDCWELLDKEKEFNDWHSMSYNDITYLVNFLNNQEERLKQTETVLQDYTDLVHGVILERIDESIRKGTNDVYLLQEIAEEIGLELETIVVKEGKETE